MQPMGYVVPTLIQVPLDGTHVKVRALHRLQRGCHEAQQTQEEESWFVLPYFGEGSVYPFLWQVQSAQVCLPPCTPDPG